MRKFAAQFAAMCLVVGPIRVVEYFVGTGLISDRPPRNWFDGVALVVIGAAVVVGIEAKG